MGRFVCHAEVNVVLSRNLFMLLIKMRNAKHAVMISIRCYVVSTKLFLMIPIKME